MAFSEWWHEGERVWRRLSGHPAGPETGEDALGVLADIAGLRRVLDRAELAAVRVARRRSASWTEIATSLGVTRQAAWERWREIDRDDETKPGTEPATATDDEPLPSRSPRQRRADSTVRVPDVIGNQWPAARKRLVEHGLRPEAAPGATLPGRNDRAWVVTDQSPESGATVPGGSAVPVWLRPDGDAGVREPRRPTPTPREMRETKEPDPAT